MRRSRSRSRRGRQGHHYSDRDRRRERDPRDHRRDEPVSRDREQASARHQAPDHKSGQQKAKEAIDKEREKARLKKLEREEAQKEKAVQKERDRAKRREGTVSELDKQLEAGGAAASPGPPAKEQAPPAEKPRAVPAAAPVVDEGLARKLFDLMDRGGKGQVSQRDMLIALRKQPPVRRLFGLPVTNLEEGGSELEARLLAIQDAFESGSGLGELGPVFEKLRAGGAGQAFGWESFLQCCREQPMQARVSPASGLISREHSTGSIFVATHQWQVVPEGSACPGGLEYKMDMETGRTLARLMPVKAPARAESRSKVTTQTVACT